jgi:hypothetical protein
LVGGGVFVIDRYNQMYVGVVGGFGYSTTSTSGTIMGGYIRAYYNKGSPSGPSVTQSFIEGFSINFTIGAVGGFGFTYNPSEFEISWEGGVVFPPEVDLTGVYLWPIGPTQYNIPY